MSFKSRQKKRAIRKSQAQARSRNGGIATRWYLTIAKTDSACNHCGGVLRHGAEMVYRHTPRTVLCKLCAEDDPSIKPRPSVRWTEWNKKRRRR